MSNRDTLGRHWRAKGNSLQAFTRDARTGKDSIEIEVPTMVTGEVHKCGGKVLRVAGVPRIFGEWRVCGKCSADIKQPRRWEDGR